MEGPAAESTSSSLVHALQSDQAEAWQQLAELYGPIVYAWCRRAGLEEPDVLDVAQNVFSAVFANVRHFRHDGAGDTFRGWLWTITRNEVVMLARRRKKEPRAPGGTEAQQALHQLPEFFTADREPSGTGTQGLVVRRAILQLRDQFDAHTWQAFWRTTVDGCSAPEVADELGMTAVAVRQAKFRVLKRLREFLAED